MKLKLPIPPGTKLRFRSWDDMVAEYGLVDGEDSIDCKFRFTRAMQKLCGKPINVPGGIPDYRWSMEYEHFDISADMLELDPTDQLLDWPEETK